jgi:flagellar basal body-associated protein FliL
MADKAEKKPEAAAAPAASAAASEKAPAGKKGGLLAKTPVLLGGVMILEAVVLFAGFKFLGGGTPRSAAGAELSDSSHEEGHGDGHGGEGEGHGDGHAGGGGGGPAAVKKTVEVPVLDFRAQNKREGRLVLYDVQIFIITKGEFEQKVRETIKDREALIKDRVRTIIAQNDPEKLGGGSEPGLETLRRQVKYQLDEIIGEGMIEEVLVPRCIPFRTDY